MKTRLESEGLDWTFVVMLAAIVAIGASILLLWATRVYP